VLGVNFRILAGDFGTGYGSFSRYSKELSLPSRERDWSHRTIPASSLAEVRIATAKDIKRLAGIRGWKLVGKLTRRRRQTNVMFVATFRNGQKFLAQTTTDIFGAIQAVTSEDISEDTPEPMGNGLYETNRDGNMIWAGLFATWLVVILVSLQVP
jgi:hypothetical protein